MHTLCGEEMQIVSHLHKPRPSSTSLDQADVCVLLPLSLQLEGLSWMVSQHQRGLNSILADEMVRGAAVLRCAVWCCTVCCATLCWEFGGSWGSGSKGCEVFVGLHPFDNLISYMSGSQGVS